MLHKHIPEIHLDVSDLCFLWPLPLEHNGFSEKGLLVKMAVLSAWAGSHKIKKSTRASLVSGCVSYQLHEPFYCLLEYIAWIDRYPHTCAHVCAYGEVGGSSHMHGLWNRLKSWSILVSWKTLMELPSSSSNFHRCNIGIISELTSWLCYKNLKLCNQSSGWVSETGKLPDNK